jgi:hypothetical protein
MTTPDRLAQIERFERDGWPLAILRALDADPLKSLDSAIADFLLERRAA